MQKFNVPQEYYRFADLNFWNSFFFLSLYLNYMCVQYMHTQYIKCVNINVHIALLLLNYLFLNDYADINSKLLISK